MAIARPMGKTSAPPFALIITVVLLVLAVVWGVHREVSLGRAQDDLVKARTQLGEATAKVSTLNAEYQKVVDELRGAVRGGDIKESSKQVAEIGLVLSETDRDIENPAVGTFKGYPIRKAIGELIDARKALLERIRQAEQQVREAGNPRIRLEQSIAELQKQAQENQAKAQEERLALIKSNEASIKDLQEQLQAKAQEVSEKVAEIEKLKIEKIDVVRKHEEETAQLKNQIDRLRRELVKLNRPVVDTNLASRDPDGDVAQITPEMDMAYLRLKRPDQARLGMRYVVFAKNQPIPSNGQGKAVLEIASLQNGEVQAKIIKSTPGDPILAGDAALNLVAGPRVFNFVIAGGFDLDNRGTIEANGRKQIETLITKWGGKVQEDIDILTNFVVLGVQPVVPEEPAAGTDPLDRRAYDQAKAERDRWNSIHDRAIAYSLPIMNETTFLYWIGYFNDDTSIWADKRVRPGEKYFAP